MDRSSVQLIGFVTFSVKERAAREGRNPRTGEVVKIKASKGNLCLDVKVVERGDSSNSLAPIFEVSLNVGGNTDYKGRVMIEAERNDGFRSGHNNPSCTDGRYRYYLVNTADSTIRRDERDYRYFLYDYVVQVPEEIASDQTPVYVLITVGDSQFYYQVK